jgi:WD40 repeat protein
MATAGLDTTVKIWDVRKMSKSSKMPTPIATQNAGKSVNSAFFSPSGKRIVTTTMSNTLDILEDAHLSPGLITKPKSRIRHDNHTGRWLCTFMARWHPSSSALTEECFVVGSIQQPRTVEIFSGNSGTLLRAIRGDALTAVASRCCFHPNADRLIVVGGNSSGRVTVAR